MKWSDLQPGARLAILAVAFLAVALVVWAWFVQPMRARSLATRTTLAQGEAQLEQMEREIESIPPAADAERAAWQRTQDELLSRLGPESELPLLIESMVRLADAQGVEIFLTSEPSTPVDASVGGNSARVIGSILGTRRVPLTARMYGDYEAVSRFVAQVGRLGWIVEVTGLNIAREFPELISELSMHAYFRPDPVAAASSAAGAGRRAAGNVGARGGR